MVEHIQVDPGPARRCASCGQLGHLRSSNKLCQNYRPKAVNAFKQEGIGQEAKVSSKISASKFFRDANLVSFLRDDLVPRLTELNLEATGIALGFVLHRLEQGLPIPMLTMSRGGVMRQFFAGVVARLRGQRNRGTNADINAYIDNVYAPLRPVQMP